MSFWLLQIHKLRALSKVTRIYPPNLRGQITVSPHDARAIFYISNMHYNNTKFVIRVHKILLKAYKGKILIHKCQRHFKNRTLDR